MSIIKTFLPLFLLFFFTACDNTPKLPLKVGISPWPAYEPLALASNKGFYEDTDVRIVRFSTPTESFRALRDGLIDVAAFTADEVFRYAEVRDKPRIFLILDISNGADAIVAKEEIKSLDDLKGKRLGVEGSALGDYVIARAMDFTKNAIKPSDMELIPIEIDKQVEAFSSNKVDAVVTYEPSKSLLINKGAHTIFDSSQIPYEIVDVLVTNENTLYQKREDLTNLSKGWFKALEFINSNYNEAMYFMSQHESTTQEEFQKGYEDLIIPSMSDNHAMLNKNNGSLIEPLQRLSRLMYDKGSLKKKIDIAPLLDDTIINAIKE